MGSPFCCLVIAKSLYLSYIAVLINTQISQGFYVINDLLWDILTMCFKWYIL